MVKRNKQNRRLVKYVTMKIPEEVVDIIDEMINNSVLGFTSRTDVIKTMTRDYYLKLEELFKYKIENE